MPTLVTGAIFGDPCGKEESHKVCLPNFTQAQVREIERSDIVEKLAKGLYNFYLLMTNVPMVIVPSQPVPISKGWTLIGFGL